MPMSNELEFPNYLYRYRSNNTEYVDAEIDQAIFHRRIFFSKAVYLNDPFEVRPVYEESPLDERIKANRRGGRLRPIMGKQVFEGKAGFGLSRKEFRRKKKKLPKDPVGFEKFNERLRRKIICEMPEHTLVACLSECGQNIPMWRTTRIIILAIVWSTGLIIKS